jgi:PAS domain-containing protein
VGTTESRPILDPSLWHPRAQRLYHYWRSIAPPGALPGRQHLDPVDIPDLLSCLWLLDVQREPFRLRYRLAGTTIIEAIGREVTGQWLDEAHPKIEDRAGFLARYSGVVENGQPSWRKGYPRLWTHRDFGAVENLLLPFARDGRTVDMLCALTVLFRRDGTVAE